MTAVFVGALVAAAVAFGAVTTSQSDYAPGSVVTISGDNSNGAGYVPGNTVNVAVSGPNSWADSCSATVAGDGGWSCTVTLSSDPAVAVGSYTYTATSVDANENPISESGTFTDIQPYCSSLSLTAPTTAASIALGSNVTVSGTLSFPSSGTGCQDGSASSVQNRTVRIEASFNGGAFASIQSATTDASGAVSYTYAPAAAGTYVYRLHFVPGDTGNSGFKEDNSGSSATITVTVVTNHKPVADAGGPYTGVEGGNVQLDGSGSYDPDVGDTIASYAWSYSVVTADAGTTCSFSSTTAESPTISCTDDGSFTVSLKVKDNHDAESTASTANLTLTNADPVVAKPSFALTSVDCSKSVSLTGISFTDAGTNDTWSVDINWGDGSTHTTYNTSTQGDQPNQSHTYTSGGTFTATVTVTDDDSGSDSDTSSNTVTVNQYTITFLQPLDASSPSKLIGNTMKSGRVVPVKATIYDLCSSSYVTDPTKTVTIVVKANGTGNLGSNDAVEVYADPGAANSNTLNFRWSADSTVLGGGFWIYNLDSKTAIAGSAMLVGTNYRVDIFVGSVRATTTQWAVLTPTK